jgi:ABC-type transporter Mla subunit MlaD
MQTRTLRDNVLAGLFVVSGLAIGVWGSFLLGERPAGTGLSFTIQFSLQQGVAGLKPGSPVLLAGKQIGQVRRVEFAVERTGGQVSSASTSGLLTPVGVNVFVEVDGSLTLYENAGIYLDRPLLGNLSSLNISSTGSPEATVFAGTPRIEPNDIVRGGIAPPAVLASMGWGPEQSEAVRRTIKDVETSAAEVRRLLQESGPKFSQGVDHAKAVLSQIDERVAQWRANVDEFLKNAEAASVSVKAASADLPDAVKEGRAFIARATRVAETTQGILDENRENLKATMASVRSVSGKVDERVVQELIQSLEQAETSLKDFSHSLNQVDQLVIEGRYDVRNTLANMSLASQEMKLITSELRAAPWRLLHRPTLKERETEDLYGATNAFAEAASSVRSAAEALSAASSSPNASPEQARRLEELSVTLNDAVKNYRDAGKRFMDELIERQE